MRVLSRDGDRAANVLLSILAHVATAERDAAGLGVEEADEQVRDRRLAGAARPDERDPAAWLEPEIDAVEREWVARRVARADAFERDRERLRRERHGVVGVCDRGLAVGQLEEPLPGCERLGQLSRGLGERLHGLERGEREQREHCDQDPIEAARGM